MTQPVGPVDCAYFIFITQVREMTGVLSFENISKNLLKIRDYIGYCKMVSPDLSSANINID